MANIAFTGAALVGENLWSDYTGPNNYPLVNRAICYQGYYRSANQLISIHTWSGVYYTDFHGAISCNLGDAGWLGTGTPVAGSKILFVFWEAAAGEDRKAPAALHGVRGWYEFTIPTVTNGTTYEVYPYLFMTNISHTYSDNVPTRYAEIDYSYSFSYDDTVIETLEVEPFYWCWNTPPFTCDYTDSTITMSHEYYRDGYGDTLNQLYANYTNIRETLTFSNGDYVQRTVGSGVTNFNHTFTDYERKYLIRTLEYEVDGVYYPDTIHQNVVYNPAIIADFSLELRLGNPARHDINVYRDRTFRMRVSTGEEDYWTFKARVKESFSSTDVLANFDIEVNTVDGYIELSLDAETTEALLDNVEIDATSANTVTQLVWDLRITTPGQYHYQLLYGNCNVHRVVTRGE